MWAHWLIFRRYVLFSWDVVSDSLRSHGLYPARLLCPWDLPGNNNGMGCHSLLQEVFLTQGSNPHLLPCREILRHWATREAPWKGMLLLLLSRFSRVRLCATPEMAAHQVPRPWDSPGKNTGVGCHFLLQCMKLKSDSEVAQSCLTLRDPMDCSPPSSSVHGIFQARVLEWGAIAFSVKRYRLSQKC